MICPHCLIDMKPGQALVNTVVGEPEFPGATVVTLHVGGPGKLVACWKCPACGHSVGLGNQEAKATCA